MQLMEASLVSAALHWLKRLFQLSITEAFCVQMYAFTLEIRSPFCAGTHLLVSGREIDGIVIWRYELGINRWFRGPNMMSPRCLFASTTCGTTSFVAGGVGANANSEVYNTAEKYSSETGSWESLPRMNKRRKLCSGCFMDDRFYVIGGRNDDGGEYFDQTRNQWEN